MQDDEKFIALIDGVKFIQGYTVSFRMDELVCIADDRQGSIVVTLKTTGSEKLPREYEPELVDWLKSKYLKQREQRNEQQQQ